LGSGPLGVVRSGPTGDGKWNVNLFSAGDDFTFQVADKYLKVLDTESDESPAASAPRIGNKVVCTEGQFLDNVGLYVDDNMMGGGSIKLKSGAKITCATEHMRVLMTKLPVFHRGDRVLISGKKATVEYGPDNQNGYMVKYEDGTFDGPVRTKKLVLADPPKFHLGDTVSIGGKLAKIVDDNDPAQHTYMVKYAETGAYDGPFIDSDFVPTQRRLRSAAP